MRKIAVIICVFFVSQQLKGQSIEDIREENNSEIELLKKEYFENLQQNQDARIFSISQQRNDYTYKKLEEKRQNASLSFIKDSINRNRLSIEKQDLFDFRVTEYNDSIANAVGYRRVSKAIEDREKKRKSEELEAANKREAFYRSQAVVLKQDDSENELKSKLKSRHARLKKKYAVKRQ